jgi:hypothetical protein
LLDDLLVLDHVGLVFVHEVLLDVVEVLGLEVYPELIRFEFKGPHGHKQRAI